MANTSRNRGIGIVTASDSKERSKGQLHIYDGEGKGKSQAALGVVLRTIGLGICEKRQSRVLLLRFLKGPERPYDEDSAIEALQRGFPHLIDHVRTGRSEFFTADQVTKFDIGEAQRGWNIAKGAIASSLYSVVVLDELNPVLDLGMLDIKEVVDSLQKRPDGLEIIITGRAAPPSLVRISQLHSEMRPRLTGDLSKRIEQRRFNGGIEIYTGEGKGKSTSALGKALQAIGKGISQDKSHRVLILQWLKGGNGYTEDAAIEALRESYPHLVDHLRSGRDAIVWRGQQQPIDYVEAERAWEIAKLAVSQNTGARGLRSIIEDALMDLMYKVPDQKDLYKVVISKEVISEKSEPILIYSSKVNNQKLMSNNS